MPPLHLIDLVAGLTSRSQRKGAQVIEGATQKLDGLGISNAATIQTRVDPDTRTGQATSLAYGFSILCGKPTKDKLRSETSAVVDALAASADSASP